MDENAPRFRKKVVPLFPLRGDIRGEIYSFILVLFLLLSLFLVFFTSFCFFLFFFLSFASFLSVFVSLFLFLPFFCSFFFPFLCLVAHSCLILLLISLCILKKLRHLEALWYKAFWDFFGCAFCSSFDFSLFVQWKCNRATLFTHHCFELFRN